MIEPRLPYLGQCPVAVVETDRCYPRSEVRFLYWTPAPTRAWPEREVADARGMNALPKGIALHGARKDEVRISGSDAAYLLPIPLTIAVKLDAA